MTTTSQIISAVDAYVATQNASRTGITPLDFNALTSAVPPGGNSVIGISGIGSGASTIALPSSGIGNTVIVDGGISTTASSSGTDSYSLAVGADGTVTLTDNNTGFSQSITGANEVVFDLAATTSAGAYKSSYIVATGNAAVIAAMYGAALEREPDFAGLDFYLSRLGSPIEPDLHRAATFILGSPEEQKLYPAASTPSDGAGPNNQQFVSEMYGGILHRTPTAAEMSFYLNALAGTLTNSSGQTLAAVDRPTVLEYFAESPENQANIAATKGGWFIDPANGAVNFGTLTQTSANAVLSSEAASGTVNASDFANMPSTLAAGTGMVSVIGADYVIPGTNIKNAVPEISTSQAKITINLSIQYYVAQLDAGGVTVNGVPTGGSLIFTPSSQPYPATGNGGAIVNLFSNNNVVYSGSSALSGITVAAIVNGWNSTDIIAHGSTNNVSGTILQGSASSPISGAALAALDHNQGFQPSFNMFAINVGSLTDDSAATMVTAANQVYRVADATAENAFFFGQDPHGNTMVFWWRGDTGHTGSIQASDISGAVELVGVQTLTGANFHS